ncbi:MAG: tRNA uridine-5-carboxymethylaminomethyl(34) synthesis enzyme MnmG [Lachnospiraceae bacterium]|jgi:tRNA uridine 5-carboxymethylaminomethyl modification enzyme|nr:tRNA uridine-5-carboxymethylaminomethyl(34) synthesis enzyme MnmG [Lachnospiraceae bacterium]
MTIKTGVSIIGGGHAGCEAALAVARLGIEAVMFTISKDSIAMMPCNPNIGGTSKGHLVREIDALGGEMGKVIDHAFIQSRMLNRSKGPAVHSLRAQADKAVYSQKMRDTLSSQSNLTIVEDEVIDIIYENGQISGVKTKNGNTYECRAIILCTGTYLNARCLCGETIKESGPNGMEAATMLTAAMTGLGIKMRRFKTGTSARLKRESLDFSQMIEQPGDEVIVPFSFATSSETVQREQVLCYLTYTNEETHKILRDNLSRSPMYSGLIKGTGTRYCPAIEDKVVKFKDRTRHQVFIEPEGLDSEVMYVSGMSTSMPEDVQEAMYKTVAGMEKCEIADYGYAIEYNTIDSSQLSATLSFRGIAGLFSAGQINGSSGYEEAAAQGLIAGINAVKFLRGEPEFTLDRAEAYIGVLIDDLITKENAEPYRMMTSRAEYRLFLRQDNADLRLIPRGYEAGLRSAADMERLRQKEEQIEEEIARLKKTRIGVTDKVNDFLIGHQSTALKNAATLAELIARPELNYVVLVSLDTARPLLSDDITEQVEINIKYSGYLERQLRQIEQFKRNESRKIPADFDYDAVLSLRHEARQKLKTHEPQSLGQAARIAGVSPADIAVLMVSLNAEKRRTL